MKQFKLSEKIKVRLSNYQEENIIKWRWKNVAVGDKETRNL